MISFEEAVLEGDIFNEHQRMMLNDYAEWLATGESGLIDYAPRRSGKSYLLNKIQEVTGYHKVKSIGYMRGYDINTVHLNQYNYEISSQRLRGLSVVLADELDLDVFNRLRNDMPRLQIIGVQRSMGGDTYQPN